MHHLFHSRQILTSDIYNLSLHDALPISQRVEIETSFITLGQFIKLANVFESGGMIKAFLQDTGVLVNGEIEQRRGRKLRSEEHTSELQSRGHLVCRLLLEKKKNIRQRTQ